MAAERYEPSEHAVRTFRATHRVDTPGLPPLYALREADALEAAEERGRAAIYMHFRDKSGAEKWEFWRSWP